MSSPIALFTHRRSDHTSRTLEALAQNPEISSTRLYVFCDGPRSDAERLETKAVRDLVRRYKAACDVEIVERDTNWGLSKSIVSGITEILSLHETVIVLEDDLVTHPQFLQYMNFNLKSYADSGRVACIHGYMYPVPGLPDFFFLNGADCWGWATWKTSWDLFDADGSRMLNELETRDLSHDFDFYGSYPYTSMLRDQIAGKNDSWAVRWYASCYLHGKLCLYPGSSLVQNIGTDQSGTHCGSGDTFKVTLKKRMPRLRVVDEQEHVKAKQALAKYFQRTRRRSATRKVRRLLRRFVRFLGAAIEYRR